MRIESGNDQSAGTPSIWSRIFSTSFITAVSIVITSVGMAATITAIAFTNGIFTETGPGVTFEIVRETHVLDVKRPLEDLSIVFRGQNVQEHNLNLRIVTINVENSGETDILQSHYDSDDDWGIHITGGEVIEARLVDTNDEYLRTKIVPRPIDMHTITFPKVIFEKGDVFTVEILLLHPKDEDPFLTAIGKIAGVDDFTILTRPLTDHEIGFLEETLSGSPVVHVVRAFVYAPGVVLSIAAVVVMMVWITNWNDNRQNRRRRQQINRSLSLRLLEQDNWKNELINLYAADGLPGLNRLCELITDTSRIRWTTSPDRWMVSGRDRSNDWTLVDDDHAQLRALFSRRGTLGVLLATGALTRGNDDSATVDPRFVEVVKNLLDELQQ